MKTLNDFFLSRPALTAGLLSHLWQSTVVAVLVLGLLLLGGRLSARTRRALAWLALAKFALPVCALVSPAGPLANLFGHGVNVDWLQLPAGLLPMMAPATAVASPGGFMAREFWAVAACVWAAGFAFLLGVWAFRAGRLGRRLLVTAGPLDGPLQQGVESAARRMGLAEPPACRSVEAGQGPGVLGVLVPVVLLPRGLESLLLPGELEAILIHEFVHVRRRDSWWNFLQMLLVSAFWFNPAVWLLQRRLNLETEKSCDEQVLAITSNPETYASGIVKTVRFSLGLPQVGFASAAMPPVTSRLREILSTARRRERRVLRVATLGAGVTLLAFSGYAGAIREDAGGMSAAVPVSPIPAVPAQQALPSAVREEAQAPVAVAHPATSQSRELPREGEKPSNSRPEAASGAAATSIPETAAAVPQPAAIAAEPIKSAPALEQSKPGKPDLVVTVAPAPGEPGAKLEAERDPLHAVRPSVAGPSDRMRGPMVAEVAAPLVAGPRIYDPGMLDKQPMPVFQPHPVYPYDMRKHGYGGEVVVEFILGTNGAVQAAFARSSTRPEFEKSAVQAVSKWRFRPGRKNGVPVNTRMQVPIVFSLDPRG